MEVKLTPVSPLWTYRSYSKSLPLFNIATGGSSNVFITSLPTVPSGATITNVTINGRVTYGLGFGWCNWNLQYGNDIPITKTFSQLLNSQSLMEMRQI